MSDFLRKTGICILNLIGAVYIGFLVDLICINIIRMNVHEDLVRMLEGSAHIFVNRPPKNERRNRASSSSGALAVRNMHL